MVAEDGLRRQEAEANGEAGPKGAGHDGASHRTALHAVGSQRQSGNDGNSMEVELVDRMVAEDGIEPPTRGFSRIRPTDEPIALVI